MLIIGICGASGSGKSTLAKSLAARLTKPCIYIKQDSYYRDHPDMSFEERERLNYDEPGIFEHDLLREDLMRLRSGQSITAKEYDYTQHRRCDPGVLIEPADVVLLESIYKQYLDTVKPMYEKHIRNYVEYADLIVARGGKNARIVDILAHYINSGLIESKP